MLNLPDPNQIGSDAWRARHAGAEAPVPMTIVGSARDQLNQPTSTSTAASPPASFESEAHAALVRIANAYNQHLDRTDRDAIDPVTGTDRTRREAQGGARRIRRHRRREKYRHRRAAGR